MINVDTVIGQPIETKTGAMIVPFSKVSFGFVSGGGEYDTNPNNQSDTAYPFAGGTGAGVCV
ncbi:MAG TPA: spore germination protein GerW family protein, partial [Clostridia bacterium]|nr:spore germination protein GerW family protein [Clostridia bacterium]